jgi:hypothetical protein
MILEVNYMDKELEGIFYKQARLYLKALGDNIDKLKNTKYIKSKSYRDKIVQSIILASHNLEGDALLAKKYNLAHDAARINYIGTKSLLNKVDNIILIVELVELLRSIKLLINKRTR